MTKRERLIKLLCDRLSNCIQVIEKTADYLLDNGVIVPPCKVGDTLYVKSSPNEITECKVYNICTNIYADNHENGGNFWKGFEVKSEAFGKTVFHTREEAEKALKERETE